MKKRAINTGKGHGAPQHIVQALGDWWTRPDVRRTAFWCSSAYQEHVACLWRNVLGNPAAESATWLFSAAMLERRELPMEYERLFVGPAAISCPPYEAVWRTDRPKHEQGTVMGKSSDEMARIYRDLGLRLRCDQVELADHIAIELEALAYAWDRGADAKLARRLLESLQAWVPAFCASVLANSRLEFYRLLAGITERCFAPESPWSAGLWPAVARTSRPRRCGRDAPTTAAGTAALRLASPVQSWDSQKRMTTRQATSKNEFANHGKD